MALFTPEVGLLMREYYHPLAYVKPEVCSVIEMSKKFGFLMRNLVF